jgi:hypothetical protein
MSSNKCSKCKKISLFLIYQARIACKIIDLALEGFFLNCTISFSYISLTVEDVAADWLPLPRVSLPLASLALCQPQPPELGCRQAGDAQTWRGRRAQLRPCSRSKRHAPHKAARPRKCRQTVPRPYRGIRLGILMRALFGAGTPKERAAMQVDPLGLRQPRSSDIQLQRVRVGPIRSGTRCRSLEALKRISPKYRLVGSDRAPSKWPIQPSTGPDSGEAMYLRLVLSEASRDTTRTLRSDLDR